jgi:hypothetical protein
MPVNTTQTKYFQNIGPGVDALSFGTMASTLGRPSTNIRFGDYRRKTSANEVFADVNASFDEKALATAIVPDSIENQTCGVNATGISSTTDHKVSTLKNMIKRYDVSHTGNVNSQLNVSPGGGIIADNWASNMDLNVPKRVTFDGSTLKASTTAEYALVFNASALNLDLKFNATQVLGKEGVGGGAGGNGSSGGGALYLRNTTTRTTGNASTVNLTLSNTALIAGGGGGGAGGAPGTVSGNTQCTNYNDYSFQNYYWAYLYGGCPESCGSDTQVACSADYSNPDGEAPSGGGSIRYFRGGGGGFSQGTWYSYPWTITCRNFRTTDNGSVAAAIGGGGGIGQGSNNANPGAGTNASGAAQLNCPSGTQNSTSTTTAGVAGGAGGTYGASGGASNISNPGLGGPWLNVSNTRWANKAASGALVQRVNTV